MTFIKNYIWYRKYGYPHKIAWQLARDTVN